MVIARLFPNLDLSFLAAPVGKYLDEPAGKAGAH